jgi:nicotinamide riboside kinase
MRIAFAGANSTGKTTLLERLSNTSNLNEHAVFIFSNARSILQEMGYQCMDGMTREKMREFQIRYFHAKKYTEQRHESFISDRSFVDIAAYWLIRDTWDKSIKEQNLILNPCRQESQKYDVIFYFPFGRIKFEPDGCRSTDLHFHGAIDSQIKMFLDEWKLNYLIMKSSDLPQRMKEVLKELSMLFRISLQLK